MDGRGRGGGAELAAGRSPARIQVMIIQTIRKPGKLGVKKV